MLYTARPALIEAGVDGTGFLTARALGSPPRFCALAPATHTKQTNTARSAVHTRDIRRDLRNTRGSAGQFIRLPHESWPPRRTSCCITGVYEAMHAAESPGAGDRLDHR